MKSILLGSWQRRSIPEVEESDAANLNWIRLDEIQFFVARPRLLDYIRWNANIQPTFEKATLRRSRSTPRTGETLDSGGLPINTWGQPTCRWLKGWQSIARLVKLIHMVCCNMIRSCLLMLFNICHGKGRSTNRRQKILLLLHFKQTAAARSLKVPDQLVASLSDQMTHVEKDINLACFWLDSI